MAKTQREDFILDKNGDFPLEDTVFQGVYLPTPYGPSDAQHVLDNIFYDKGWNKRSPWIGFGMNNYRNSEFSIHTVTANLEDAMKKDDYKVMFGAVVSNGKKGFTVLGKYIKRAGT